MSEVNLITPTTWRAQHFWITGRRRTWGVVAALAPTVFAIGLEFIRGSSRGVGLMIGPLWLGIATLTPTDLPPLQDTGERDGR